MRPMTTIAILLGAVLGFLETNADNGPGAVPAASGAAAVEEGEVPVSVELDGSRSQVVFRMPAEAVGLPVSYSVTIEDLDGRDVGQSRGRRDVMADGTLTVSIVGPAVKQPDAAAEYVVVYRLRGDSGRWSGRVSLFHCMTRTKVAFTPPTIAAMGENVLIPVRVLGALGEAAVGADVSFEATMDGRRLFDGRWKSDESGSALVKFKAEKVGDVGWKLTVRARGSLPVVETGSISVSDVSKLLLTLDKPLYQPGQQVHVRALLLQKPSLKPRAGAAVLFEGFDSKGNKIFKHQGKSNEFGVVATELSIGSQVNMGSWRIEASAGGETTSKSFTVDRYALPKFKGSIELDKPFYTPGQVVKGSVNLRYFFGKAVAGGKVKVTAHDYQGDWVVHRVFEGQTSADGTWGFSYELPQSLIGQPLGNGNAVVLLQFEGEDTAGQSWKDSRQVTVVASPVSVVVVPESGALVNGVSNRLHVAVADAGGAPVTGRAKVWLAQVGLEPVMKDVELDGNGMAELTFTPDVSGRGVQARVEVDYAGGKVAQTVSLASSLGQSLLLRTGKSIAKVGDILELELLSAESVGDAWVDITRENQTVMTANVRMKDGRGRLRITLDASMAGTLTVSGYVMTQRAELTRDSRVVLVNMAGDLKVDVSADKQQYKPAERAKLSFRVTDESGGGVQTSLGVHIVDEAVFALSEARPGLAKLYFLLEAALMEPSWQVGPLAGQTLGGLMGQTQAPRDEEERQRMAEVAIASRGDVATTAPAVLAYSDFTELVASRMEKRAGKMSRRLARLARSNAKCDFDSYNWRNVSRLGKRVAELYSLDPWGKAYQVELSQWGLSVTSAGPDEVMGTYDDLTAYVDPYEMCEGERGWVRGIGDAGPGRRVMVGRGGGRGDMVREEAMVPMAAGMALDDVGAVVEKKRDQQERRKDSPKSRSDSKKEPEVRVRQWFPETLFVENNLITDESGRATLEVPLADSITSWRMSAMASDRSGRIGGAESGIVVFQDFFVDIDFPAFLTRNDELSFPVVVYNYLDRDQTVTITLDKEDWFELEGDAEVSVALHAGQVKALRFPVKVTKVGWHQLTVWGRTEGGGGAADAVRRSVEVRSDGMEVVGSSSGQFDSGTAEGREIRLPYHVPEEAIAGSQKMLVQILPALSTHVVGGMESMLRLPGGCFEQTTSSAWPNVLAMKYLRDTKQNTPEISMKAAQYILSGYQRILTFECRSGGFNWWEGENPGNLILSALAIMMLTDTKEVLDAVDSAVIKRAFTYLLTLQRQDGSFAAERHLHAGNENLGQDDLRSTCYVAWALNEGGFGKAEATKMAMRYIQSRVGGEQDTYTLALCANAMATASAAPGVDAVLSRVFKEAVREGKKVHFGNRGATLVNSGGLGGSVELTALVAHAALKAGKHLSEIPAMVEWLISTKDPQGNWGYNTQASVMALKVFLLAATMGSSGTNAEVAVELNGKALATRKFTDFNRDVLWQVDVSPEQMGRSGELVLRMSGEGNLGYQVVGTWYVPAKAQQPATQPLEVKVDYDRTWLKVDESLSVKVTVKANDAKLAGMVMLTVGVPPGFDVDTGDLIALRSSKRISKWELAGRQLLIYLSEVPRAEALELNYKMKARYPVKAATGESEVHMYYDAEKQGKDAGLQLTVE